MQQDNIIAINGNVVFENGKLNGGLLSFMLYDTYGFPFDLTQQILKEHNIEIDEADFNNYLEQQKQRSKDDRAKNDNVNAKNNEIFKQLALRIQQTEKEFYKNNAVQCKSKILAIIHNGNVIDNIDANKECWIVLDKTIFYANSGGEVGDKGVISNSKVLDTKKLYGEMIGHFVLTRENFEIGDVVECYSFRKNVCKNHTATHLLHSALKIVLGSSVQQKGSQVDENGFRFDFSSTKAMTSEEIERTEKIVNDWINDYLNVQIDEMPKTEAEKLDGVMKLFDEKYGEKVRVVRVFGVDGKPISTEFCGGIHCKNTGEIEAFAIESEKSIGSGIRRITAITGADKCLVLANFRDMKSSFEMIKNEMIKYKSNPAVQARYEAVYEMRENAKEVNGVILMQGKNINEETTKIACRHISFKKKKPVLAVIANKINDKMEYFCYITCQKENNFDCKAFATKLIAQTNGKGGGAINFAQVKHNCNNLDYSAIL